LVLVKKGGEEQQNRIIFFCYFIFAPVWFAVDFPCCVTLAAPACIFSPVWFAAV
jgi:hypothetical protein